MSGASLELDVLVTEVVAEADVAVEVEEVVVFAGAE